MSKGVGNHRLHGVVSDNQPTLAKRLAQKGRDSGTDVPSGIHLYPNGIRRKAPTYHHGKWIHGTGKPAVALSALVREQATIRKPRRSRMPQQANALDNAGDTLTWGG